MTINALFVLACVAAGVLTVYACVWLRKLWALYLNWSAGPCEHGRRQPCPFCDHARRMAEAAVEHPERQDWGATGPHRPPTGLTGASIPTGPTGATGPALVRPPKRPRGLESDF